MGPYGMCRCFLYIYLYVMKDLNPLKGRGVNWLHFAIQV